MEQLTSDNKFTFHGEDAGLSVVDFWSWAYSDLLNNTDRGVLAEYIVHSALLPPPDSKMRTDWLPFDLTSPTGQRIEVKSASYLQSWDEAYHEHIQFSIAPHRAWDPKAGYSPDIKRHSDLYVFCLYKALTKDVSPLALEYWEFYVLPTYVLNEQKPNQKNISLNSLKALKPYITDFAGLRDVILNCPTKRA